MFTGHNIKATLRKKVKGKRKREYQQYDSNSKSVP